LPATASTTNSLRDRLKAVESKIREARDERAGAQADLDRHREEFTQGAGQADNSNPAWRQAHAAAERLNAARGKVEALDDEQRNILALFGEGAAPAGASGTSRDLERPGGWLAAAMHAEAPGGGGSRFAASLTKVQIGSVEDLARVFFDRLADLSAVGAAVANLVDIDTSQLRVPRLTGRLPAAAATPELSPMPQQDPPFETVTVEPPKYGVLTGLSTEAYRDARPPILAAAERELISSIARGFDAAAFTGAAAPQVGMLNTSGVAVVDAAAALTNLDVFVRAVGALRAAGARPGAIFLAPATWQRLQLLKAETGSNLPLVGGQPHAVADGPAERLLGLPVYLSEGMPAANALVVDVAELLLVRRSQVEVEVFEHYGFATGEVGVRAIARLALVVGQPAGVAKIINLPTT
jgi:HK97 family phage major capsid protein